MRAVLAIAVVALFLAGCSSSPDTAVDPEEAKPIDPWRLVLAFTVVATAVAALVGVLLVVRLRQRREPGGTKPKAP